MYLYSSTNLRLFYFFGGNSAIAVVQTSLQLFLYNFSHFEKSFHKIITQMKSFSGGLSQLPSSAYFRKPCFIASLWCIYTTPHSPHVETPRMIWSGVSTNLITSTWILLRILTKYNMCTVLTLFFIPSSWMVSIINKKGPSAGSRKRWAKRYELWSWFDRRGTRLCPKCSPPPPQFCITFSQVRFRPCVTFA